MFHEQLEWVVMQQLVELSPGAYAPGKSSGV